MTGPDVDVDVDVDVTRLKDVRHPRLRRRGSAARALAFGCERQRRTAQRTDTTNGTARQRHNGWATPAPLHLHHHPALRAGHGTTATKAIPPTGYPVNALPQERHPDSL